MSNTFIDKNEDHPATCPACGTDNIYEDDGWLYCNECGAVWEEE